MKIYIANLYRFGYDLSVADETITKAKAALMNEYKKTYARWNSGDTPTAAELKNARQDIEITPYTIGKVEWH